MKKIVISIIATALVVFGASYFLLKTDQSFGATTRFSGVTVGQDGLVLTKNPFCIQARNSSGTTIYVHASSTSATSSIVVVSQTPC